MVGTAGHSSGNRRGLWDSPQEKEALKPTMKRKRKLGVDQRLKKLDMHCKGGRG